MDAETDYQAKLKALTSGGAAVAEPPAASPQPAPAAAPPADPESAYQAQLKALTAPPVVAPRPPSGEIDPRQLSAGGNAPIDVLGGIARTESLGGIIQTGLQQGVPHDETIVSRAQLNATVSQALNLAKSGKASGLKGKDLEARIAAGLAGSGKKPSRRNLVDARDAARAIEWAAPSADEIAGVKNMPILKGDIGKRYNPDRNKAEQLIERTRGTHLPGVHQPSDDEQHQFFVASAARLTQVAHMDALHAALLAGKMQAGKAGPDRLPELYALQKRSEMYRQRAAQAAEQAGDMDEASSLKNMTWQQWVQSAVSSPLSTVEGAAFGLSPAEFQKYAPVGGRLLAGGADLAATIAMAALSGGTTAAARLTTGAIIAPMAAGAAVTAKDEGVVKGAAELNPLKAFWDPHADWEDKTLAVLQTGLLVVGGAHEGFRIVDSETGTRSIMKAFGVDRRTASKMYEDVYSKIKSTNKAALKEWAPGGAKVAPFRGSTTATPDTGVAHGTVDETGVGEPAGTAGLPLVRSAGPEGSYQAKLAELAGAMRGETPGNAPPVVEPETPASGTPPIETAESVPPKVKKPKATKEEADAAAAVALSDEKRDAEIEHQAEVSGALSKDSGTPDPGLHPLAAAASAITDRILGDTGSAHGTSEFPPRPEFLNVDDGTAITAARRLLERDPEGLEYDRPVGPDPFLREALPGYSYRPETTGLANQVQADEAFQGVIEDIDPSHGENKDYWQQAGKAAVEAHDAFLKGEGSVANMDGDYEALAGRIAAGEVDLNPTRIGALLEGKRRLMYDVFANEDAFNTSSGFDQAAADRLDASRERLMRFLHNVQKGKGQWSDIGRALQAGTTLDHGSPADVLTYAETRAQNSNRFLDVITRDEYGDLVDDRARHLEELSTELGKAREVIKAHEAEAARIRAENQLHFDAHAEDASHFEELSTLLSETKGELEAERGKRAELEKDLEAWKQRGEGTRAAPMARAKIPESKREAIKKEIEDLGAKLAALRSEGTGVKGGPKGKQRGAVSITVDDIRRFQDQAAIVGEMARGVVRYGAATLDEIVDHVVGVLKGQGVDIERQAVIDAYAGSGQMRTISEAAKRQLELNRLAKSLSTEGQARSAARSKAMSEAKTARIAAKKAQKRASVQKRLVSEMSDRLARDEQQKRAVIADRNYAIAQAIADAREESNKRFYAKQGTMAENLDVAAGRVDTPETGGPRKTNEQTVHSVSEAIADAYEESNKRVYGQQGAMAENLKGAYVRRKLSDRTGSETRDELRGIKTGGEWIRGKFYGSPQEVRDAAEKAYNATMDEQERVAKQNTAAMSKTEEALYKVQGRIHDLKQQIDSGWFRSETKSEKTVEEAVLNARAVERDLSGRIKKSLQHIDESKLRRVGRVVLDAPRSLALAGHGGVGMMSHSGKNFFIPSAFEAQVRSTLDAYRMTGLPTKKGQAAARATHERLMQDMENHSDYAYALRSGLAISGGSVDDLALVNETMGKFGDIGNRGMDALKLMRFRTWVKEAPKYLAGLTGDERVAAAKDLAASINEATGHPGGKTGNLSRATGGLLLSPSLEVARWAPIKNAPRVISILARKAAGKAVTEAEYRYAMLKVRRTAEFAGTYLAVLGLNYGLQKATGQEDLVNFFDMTKNDWLKIKWNGKTFDLIGSAAAPFRLLAQMFHAATSKPVRGGSKTDAMFTAAMNYGRGKLSPTASHVIEAVTQEDFSGRPTFFANQEAKDKAELTGKGVVGPLEYGLSFLPLPAAGASRDIFDETRKHTGDSLAQLVLIGGSTMLEEMAGVRIGRTPEREKYDLLGRAKSEVRGQGSGVSPDQKMLEELTRIGYEHKIPEDVAGGETGAQVVARRQAFGDFVAPRIRERMADPDWKDLTKTEKLDAVKEAVSEAGKAFAASEAARSGDRKAFKIESKEQKIEREREEMKKNAQVAIEESQYTNDLEDAMRAKMTPEEMADYNAIRGHGQ